MSHRVRNVALIAGLIALGVALPFGPAILTEFYYRRLQLDSGFFLEAVKAPENQLFRRALGRYLSTEEGQTAALDAFLQAVETCRTFLLEQRAASLQCFVTKGNFQFG